MPAIPQSQVRLEGLRRANDEIAYTGYQPELRTALRGNYLVSQIEPDIWGEPREEYARLSARDSHGRYWGGAGPNTPAEGNSHLSNASQLTQVYNGMRRSRPEDSGMRLPALDNVSNTGRDPMPVAPPRFAWDHGRTNDGELDQGFYQSQAPHGTNIVTPNRHRLTLPPRTSGITAYGTPRLRTGLFGGMRRSNVSSLQTPQARPPHREPLSAPAQNRASHPAASPCFAVRSSAGNGSAAAGPFRRPFG